MPKCLFINSVAKTVTESDYEIGGGIQKLLGGYMEVGYQWGNGDVLYVDEEGLMKYRHGFRFARRLDQPLAGSGVVVGREREGRHYPGGYTTLDPIIGAEELAKMVRFLDNWRGGV